MNQAQILMLTEAIQNHNLLTVPVDCLVKVGNITLSTVTIYIIIVGTSTIIKSINNPQLGSPMTPPSHRTFREDVIPTTGNITMDRINTMTNRLNSFHHKHNIDQVKSAIVQRTSSVKWNTLTPETIIEHNNQMIQESVRHLNHTRHEIEDLLDVD